MMADQSLELAGAVKAGRQGKDGKLLGTSNDEARTNSWQLQRMDVVDVALN